MEESNTEDSSLGPKRKRNFKSSVWSEFDLIKRDDREKAKCRQCGIEYSYDSRKGGTSTLQRHVQKCARIRANDGSVLLLSHTGGSESNNNTTGKVEIEELKTEDQIPVKRKRALKSSVWNEFDLIKKSGREKAKCKHCHVEYIYDSKRSGTSTLQRHFQKWHKLGGRESAQKLLSPVTWNGNTSVEQLVTNGRKLDQSVFREKVAMAIVKHNYPFTNVEDEGFRDIFNYLNTEVQHISQDIAQADILQLHSREKGLARKRLLSASGKICLTLDVWTSVTTDSYLCLTAQFINQDWALQKLVLEFSHMPRQHSDHVVATKVLSALSDWGIEEKIFSITLDDAIVNDTCVQAMKDELSLKGALYSGGEYFHVHCCAHILNLIVKEGLETVNVAVEKIRHSINYLKGSQSRKEKFFDIVTELGLTEKRALHQDDPKRWNSTFVMLDSCLLYQKAFEHLNFVDENYHDCPTPGEWEQIAMITKFLKTFCEVTHSFAKSKYTTSDVYFQGVWKIQMILKKECNNTNDFVRLIAERMQLKFRKYWSRFSILLGIAVVLDPRKKLSFVEFCYQKLYPEAYGLEVENVRKRMDLLYGEYSSSTSKNHTSNTSTNTGSLGEVNTSTFDEDAIGEELQEFASFQSTDRQSHMSELDFYMLEPQLPLNQELDILQFWRAQEYRYPNLARMARDILTIPISTVSSESAFNLGGRMLDQYRSSLTPETAEALVTTRDWLYGVGVDYLEARTDEFFVDILAVENLSSDCNTFNIAADN